MAKYINDERLTDKVIEDMLEKCGLKIIKTKYDRKIGDYVNTSGIVRWEDQILINCQNMERNEIANKIIQKFPQLGMFSYGGEYSVDEEYVFLDDFFATRMKFSDGIEPLDEKLFNEYYNVMCSLFGKEYEKDAQAEYERLKAEEKENNNQTEEKTNEDKEKNKNTEEPQLGE